MGNEGSKGGSGNDRCVSDYNNCIRECATPGDLCSVGRCATDICRPEYDKCRESNNPNGVSAGGSLSTSFDNGRPYRKQNDIMYINHGSGEIPYNGKLWNGKCYAVYKNGKWSHFEDSNGNGCCSMGYLGNEDTSNGGGSD